MTVGSAEDLRGDIIRLVPRRLPVRDYALTAAHLIGRRLPFDGVCVVLLDPATLLPTGEIVENGLPNVAMRRMAEIEIAEPDFNTTDQTASHRP